MLILRKKTRCIWCTLDLEVFKILIFSQEKAGFSIMINNSTKKNCDVILISFCTIKWGINWIIASTFKKWYSKPLRSYHQSVHYKIILTHYCEQVFLPLYILSSSKTSLTTHQVNLYIDFSNLFLDQAFDQYDQTLILSYSLKWP